MKALYKQYVKQIVSRAVAETRKHSYMEDDELIKIIMLKLKHFIKEDTCSVCHTEPVEYDGRCTNCDLEGTANHNPNEDV